MARRKNMHEGQRRLKVSMPLRFGSALNSCFRELEQATKSDKESAYLRTVAEHIANKVAGELYPCNADEQMFQWFRAGILTGNWKDNNVNPHDKR